jgi:hypothetical protein
MKLSKEQLNTFIDIYFESYGVSLPSQGAEEKIIEVTQLLKEIIKINYKDNDKQKTISRNDKRSKDGCD